MGDLCLNVCIISDPETGRGYWCEDCPELVVDQELAAGKSRTFDSVENALAWLTDGKRN